MEKRIPKSRLKNAVRPLTHHELWDLRLGRGMRAYPNDEARRQAFLDHREELLAENPLVSARLDYEFPGIVDYFRVHSDERAYLITVWRENHDRKTVEDFLDTWLIRAQAERR